MNNQAIAENVKALRAARHWTQEELSLASEVDVRTIQRAESGQPLAVDSLKKLAACFDVTIELLGTSREDMQAVIEAFQKKYRLIDLKHLEPGSDLRVLFGGHAYFFHRAGQLSEQQLDEIASFEQDVRDYGDLWDELDPIPRREAEKATSTAIARLRDLNVSISAGRIVKSLRPASGGEPFRMDTLYVAAVAGPTPLLCVAEEKNVPVSLA